MVIPPRIRAQFVLVSAASTHPHHLCGMTFCLNWKTVTLVDAVLNLAWSLGFLSMPTRNRCLCKLLFKRCDINLLFGWLIDRLTDWCFNMTWHKAGWPLTWKTWKSQGIPKWSRKSQGKWKKSGEVKSGVFFQALNTPKLVFWPGLRPGPRWGAYNAPPDSLVGWGGGNPIPFPPAVTTPTVL